MNLDINTPKGQESLIAEREVIKKIKDKWGKHGVGVIETNKKKHSRIDNLIYKNDELMCVAEVKCRDMTLKQMSDWGDTWLITNQKIEDGISLSKLLATPFFGFLYLIPDDIVLYWKITNDDGDVLFNYEIRDSKTQYSINGGVAFRKNAYLPRKYAKIL
jgi:hypothetical protein